jgi:hypothetical protein
MKVIFIFSLLFLISCSSQNSSLHSEYKHDEYDYREPASFQTCYQSLTPFFRNYHPEVVQFNPLKKINSLNDLDKLLGDQSYLDIQRNATQEEIKAHNQLMDKLFRKPLYSNHKRKKTTYVTKEEAEILRKDVTYSTVNKNHVCYDPNYETGFCFARATIGHIEALLKGVDPNSIRKIWIVGDMGKWGHHVATLIKAKEGWYVYDSIFEKVLTSQEWFNALSAKKNPEAKDLMVFVSKSERFGPESANGYSPFTFFNTDTNTFNREDDFYKGYFHDYFEELDKSMKDRVKFPPR